MKPLDRRGFLSTLSCSLAAIASERITPVGRLLAGKPKNDSGCWLDVCAPFVIEDDARGLRTRIILTSDTFAGARPNQDGADVTDYEIYLYDADGRAIGRGGEPRRLTVPAMRTTVIAARDLMAGADGRNFWGGMRIRLRSRCRGTSRAGDLFSSAFNTWQSASSFDNVHAHPDPMSLQNTESYYYSMPFPSLADYECHFSIFNPYDDRSSGEITIHDPFGEKIITRRYELKPHASLIFDLNSNRFTSDFGQGIEVEKPPSKRNHNHGLLAVTNDRGTVKNFGYMMMRQNSGGRFSIEHPLHQTIFKPGPSAAPFDAQNQFRAKNVLYTPLLFHQKKIGKGALTLESRFYMGAGLPLEESQWFYPFAVDGDGNAIWSSIKDEKLSAGLPGQTELGVIKLSAGQSCALDFNRLSMPPGVSGGIGVAVSPDTTHTILKIEVRALEWNAFAFTHFRPGLRSARAYQKAEPRGGLFTDYIVAGARLRKGKTSTQRDELIAVLNIDDQGLEGRPAVELYGPAGLIKRLPLGVIPPFACRHFLLSELLAGEADYQALTLRLVDERATLLMSAVHLDYARRDLALEHGSDRFSTYADYSC
jgi:hypothetical protein